MSEEERARCYAESQGEVSHETERVRRAVRRREKVKTREERHITLVEKEWEREEKRRKLEAEAARKAGEALRAHLRREYTMVG